MWVRAHHLSALAANGSVLERVLPISLPQHPRQVQPLLPGAPPSRILITRHRVILVEGRAVLLLYNDRSKFGPQPSIAGVAVAHSRSMFDSHGGAVVRRLRARDGA